MNGDREMAYMLYLAGFDVKDVHMTDLIAGRETLEDVNLIVYVGGFSNSDVLGSAKGWAGAFKYNEKARVALENFYKREDTVITSYSIHYTKLYESSNSLKLSSQAESSHCSSFK